MLSIETPTRFEHTRHFVRIPDFIVLLHGFSQLLGHSSKTFQQEVDWPFLIFVFPWENVVFWYVDITKSMCGWPPEFVRKLSAGGGQLWRATSTKKAVEDGKKFTFFCRFFSWTKWIWMKLFFHFVEWQLNWDSETCRIFYQKVLQKRSITILCQQIFQKVASPQTGTHLGQDPIPVDTRWGNPILQKNTVKKKSYG